jgi:DNA primase
MALQAAFLDELRARVPLADLIGRGVKLARSGRQWKGCCPFHDEKTPSFYVYDDHFHCFGCGAHGDAIAFVMQCQNAAFPEAVAQLAAEAGLEVPKPTPNAAEADRRRSGLFDVLAAAAAAFGRRLHLPEGRAALAYLRGRGLTDATIARFGLGWSGEGRGALAAELSRDGISPDALLEAGLLRPAEQPGGPTPELFFNRLMFPIRDRAGRVISFGGRTLGDGQPKYVNGPETALFAKRRSLYGIDRAREGARNSPAIVVEGYMDVIALHQAGFAAAVAPLGTALTEEQLAELWRLAPDPIVCFDGDAAGGRAAARVAELALPLIAPDRTLRFAALPEGEDPDSIIRRHGAGAFKSIVDAARPLAVALYDLIREQTGAETPHDRARLYARLSAAAQRIGDRQLGREYRDALLERFFAARRARRPPHAGAATAPARPPISPAKTSNERARNLVAGLIFHPELIAESDHSLARLDLPPPARLLQAGIAQVADLGEPLDTGELLSHLGRIGLQSELDWVLSASPMPLPHWVRPDAPRSEFQKGWLEIVRHEHGDALRREIDRARSDLAVRFDDANQRRLIALVIEQMGYLDDEPVD